MREPGLVVDPLWTFTVRGICGGVPAVARWNDGRLDCPTEVRSRAEVIVAMGERFQRGAVTVVVTLTEPLPALLTVVRAMDSVTDLTVDASPREMGQPR